MAIPCQQFSQTSISNPLLLFTTHISCLCPALPSQCLTWLGGSQASQQGLTDRGSADICAWYLQKSTLQTQQIPSKWLQGCPFIFLGMRMGSTQPVTRQGSPWLSPHSDSSTMHSVIHARLLLTRQKGGHGEHAAMNTEWACW